MATYVFIANSVSAKLRRSGIASMFKQLMREARIVAHQDFYMSADAFSSDREKF
jgi:hypothetical protein